MTKAKLLNLALKFIKITHHSKGRLRLDVSSKIKNEEALQGVNLEEIFSNKGIREVKLNKILGKITILYDSDVINYDDLQGLMSATDENEIQFYLEKLGL